MLYVMDEQIPAKELAAVRHIRNWLVHYGRLPSVRELMGALRYKSPRSAAILIGRLIERGILRRRMEGGLQFVEAKLAQFSGTQTVDVPLIGTVPCGSPIMAEENIEGFVSVSTSIAKPGSKYFLLRASGDSMSKAGIDDGDMVLVRQQPIANTGDKVVALVDGEATLKEYRQKKGMIVLMPRSSNPRHRPIILTKDFQVQGVVVRTIPTV